MDRNETSKESGLAACRQREKAASAGGGSILLLDLVLLTFPSIISIVRYVSAVEVSTSVAAKENNSDDC